VVNSIIGSGIFGLPSAVAGLVGRFSPGAVLVAGAAIGVIMLCFAEVASRFSQTGGPYLYARTAFGRFTGIEMGWLFWLSQLASPAANANLFVIYLGEFWAHSKDPLPRFLILTLLVAVLAFINYRGVRGGTGVSNIFTIAKLLPLAVVVVTGLFYIHASHATPPPAMALPGGAAWLKAIFLLFFAYGGFESALAPMGEAKNPCRDVAFALLVGLATCTLVYTLIQRVVIGVLPDPAHSERPLADAARLIMARFTMGRSGAAFMAVGALISTYGLLSAKILAVPRITFALAEQRDFPSLFAAIHPRFRTPYLSVLAFAGLVWLLALFGSFSWNVTLTVFSRLFYFAVVCAALPVLRKKHSGEAQFRLPAGNFFAGLGILICLVLVTRVDFNGALIVIATIVAALLNWLWVRRRKSQILAH